MPCRPPLTAQASAALPCACCACRTDRVVEMRRGAMGELRLGNTAELRVDVGL